MKRIAKTVLSYHTHQLIIWWGYGQVEQCDQFTDPGAYATATDNIDTDEELTSMIVTAGMPVDTTVLGIHQITYQLSDSAGNSGGQVRQLTTSSTDHMIPFRSWMDMITCFKTTYVQSISGACRKCAR